MAFLLKLNHEFMEILKLIESKLILEGDRFASMKYWSDWKGAIDAEKLLLRSIEEIPWRQDYIHMMGKKIPIPRLQNWFGVPGTSYTYSRITLPALPFPKWMNTLRKEVQITTGEVFNSVLVNYYRDGKDSNDWHSDDEKELGNSPIIASISLGAERIFHLRHKDSKEKIKINLLNGSLLLMGAGIQEYWQHKLAKTAVCVGPRINFTFRNLM